MKLFPAVRPYWHVDAKWICGILLFLLLAASLFLYSLVQLTNEKNGPTLAALVIGAAFVRGDEEQIKADAKEELAKQGGKITPIPNFPEVVITEEDLNLSVTEIKLKVFKPLAESFYQDGVEGTADKYAKTPEERDKFVNDAFFFRIFTKQTHETLQSRLSALLLVCLILLIGVIYFSAGWGRLANPGIILVAVSLPGTLLALAVSNQPKDARGDKVLGFLPLDLGQEVGKALGQSYSRATLIGAILLLGALIGKIVTTIIKKHRAKHTGPSHLNATTDTKKLPKTALTE